MSIKIGKMGKRIKREQQCLFSTDQRAERQEMLKDDHRPLMPDLVYFVRYIFGNENEHATTR